MKLRLSSWIVAFIATTWIGSASAATITQAGITGLDVGGVLYNVAIGDMDSDAVADVYSGYTGDLALTGIDNITLVAVNTALVDALDGPDGDMYSASYFDGCGGIGVSSCTLFAPTKYQGSPETFYASGTPMITTAGGVFWFGQDVTQDHENALGSNASMTYAVVTRVSPVPLPAAAWLFISALGGLVEAKRKQLKA